MWLRNPDNAAMASSSDPSADAERGAWHAAEAANLLAEAGGLPEQLMLGFVSRAAAHASLAVYHELRAQR